MLLSGVRIFGDTRKKQKPNLVLESEGDHSSS